MKHPAHEEWLAYHYGDVADTGRAALRDHLQNCADCQARLAEFEQTARALDEWKIPAAPWRVRRPALEWAAAAAVLLFAGFALGRATATDRREVATLRAEMKQLAAQSRADASADTARLLGEMNDSWKAQLQSVQLQHTADYASLRKELETVAVLTQAGLQQAQQQIVQLAEYSEPAAADANKP